MILQFYCRRIDDLEHGPLLATASISAEDSERPDACSYGIVTLFHPDTSRYKQHYTDWTIWIEHFYSSIKSELNRYIIVRHHPPLKPWSRLAFEQIGQFGILSLRRTAVAKLYEDDGTEWDPSTAIPLYGLNPDPYGKSGEITIPTTSNMRTKGRINPPRPQTEDAGSAEDQTAG